MITYKVTCDGLPLLDAEENLKIESGGLDRRITDGMFEADFSFSILPDHENYGCIQPKKSVIRVTDNGKEIFRGDVIPGKESHTKALTLTCQSHIKWLADVPDLWSMAGKTDQHPKGTVAEMFEAVFCEAADASSPTGYNAYAEPGREIYRGVCDITAEIDYCGNDSVYANVKKWISDGRGYAKIVKNATDGLYYIHLLTASGTQIENGHKVKIGENVIDCVKTYDCGSLATGIYPVGTDGSTRVTLEGSGDITGRTGYSVAQQTVWHGASVTRYGKIVRYREYPVGDVAAADRQQYLREKAADDLAKLIKNSVTYEIRVVDERLTGGTGDGPEPGNYYRVDIPQTNGPEWMQMTRLVTDLLKPSNEKEYYGADLTNISGVMKTATAAMARANAAQKTANAAATPAQVDAAIENAVKPFTVDAVITSTTLTSTKTVSEFKAAVDAGKTILISTGTDTYTAVGYYATGYTVTIVVPATGDTYTGTSMALTDTLVLDKT